MLINIKKMKIEDLDQVYNLLNKLHDSTIDYSLFKEKFENCLQDENFYGIVAITDNKTIIGVIISRIVNTLTQDKNFLVIDEMIVEERFRNKGIGKALLRDIIRFGLKNNCEIAEITNRISNEKGTNFCEDNGFQKKYYKFQKNIKRI